MNILKKTKLSDYFFILILLVAIILPLIALVKVSQYNDQSLGLYPVEVGGLNASLSASNTAVTPGDSVTVSVDLSAPDTTTISGYSFSILVPAELQVSESSINFENFGGNPRDFNAVRSPYPYDTTYDEVQILVAFTPAIESETNVDGVSVSSFDVSIPSTASGGSSYDIKFRPTKASNPTEGFDQTFGDAGKNNILNISTLPGITLSVESANTNPTVSLSTDASSYTKGDVITASATASDPDSGDGISKVTFRANNTSKDVTTASGGVYTTTYDTSNWSAGSYNITATAYDNNGGISTASSKTVTITDPVVPNDPPTTTITAPTTKVKNDTTFNVTASYSDDDAVTSASVRITNSSSQAVFTDTKNITGTSSSGNVSFEVTGLQGGSYTIEVTVIDTDSAVGTDTADLSVNRLPQVSLTSPNANYTAEAPASVTLQANASDPDGDTTSVKFMRLSGNSYVDISGATTNPYTWNISTPGSYTVVARATDSLDQYSDSSPVSFTVTEPSATLSDVTGLNLGIVLQGRDPSSTVIENKGYANSTVFVGLWRENTKELLESRIVATNKGGYLTTPQSNFFAGNGSAYTLEETDVIIVKPESYLSRAFTVGSLGITGTDLQVVSNEMYLAGDTLVDEGNKYRVGGDYVDLGNFDKVTLFDYTLFKLYVINRSCGTNIAVDVLDYNGNNIVDVADYSAYLTNLNSTGAIKNYDSSLLNAVETKFRENVSGDVIDLSNTSCVN